MIRMVEKRNNEQNLWSIFSFKKACRNGRAGRGVSSVADIIRFFLTLPGTWKASVYVTNNIGYSSSMQRPRAVVLALLCVLSLAHARLLYSGPEDLYAFPKYRTTFLNNLPVHNDTVQRWLRDGLRGGEREFLNQLWDESAWYPQPPYKEIGSSELEIPNDASQICTLSVSHLKFIYSQSLPF